MKIRNFDPSRNDLFLRNIYARGPFQGHGFICPPQFMGIADHPDYDFTISDKPVENWVPWVVENYERRSQTIYQERFLPCPHLKNYFPM